MYINIFIPQIFREIWQHKLRSILAIFCIAFGIFSVIMLSALGDGFYKAQMNEMMVMVDNYFYVWYRGSTKSSDGYVKGQSNPITIKDVLELPKIFPAIKEASPDMNKSAVLSYAGKAHNRNVCGVAPNFAQLFKLKLIPGSRFINQVDLDNHARVVVLGGKIKKIIFGPDDALGEKFLINNVPFIVVGVISTGSGGWDGFDNDVLISYKSYEKLYGDNQVNNFFVLTKTGVNLKQCEQMLRGHFARKCNFDKNDEEAIGFWGSNKIYKFFHWFFIAVQIFLSFCGLMILAVGALGVANIMFLIVAERSYEIGLCKAIGATDKQILIQLLFEALIIIGIGGVLGIVTSFFTVTFLQHVTLPTWIGVPTLSWIMVVLAVVTLALVGLTAGFFPARRAAKMDPVEALLM